MLMTINMLTHHQSGLTDAIYRCLGDSFRLASFQPVSQHRKNHGFVDSFNDCLYHILVWESDDSKRRLYRWIDTALEMLVTHLARLIESPDLCRTLGDQARVYLRENWSADKAAQRLIGLSEALLGGGQVPQYEDGPCSPDPALRPNEYPMTS